MTRKFIAILAALALGATLFAPAAEARDRGGRYHGGYYGHGGYYYDRHDHDDAVAAGVLGLVLGVALGAAVSQPPPQARCYDNYRRCAPPPPPPGCCYRQGYAAPRGYYEDPRYADPRQDPYSAYEDDYGYRNQGYYAPPRQPQCTRRERQWDRYAQRYVTVDVPC